jgi:hypothetical protein
VLGRHETQDLVARLAGFNSRRRDVAPSDPSGVIDPARPNEYILYQSEQALPFLGRPQNLATRLPPRRPRTPISPTGRG